MSGDFPPTPEFPMSDIVERLRDPSCVVTQSECLSEIERLRAERNQCFAVIGNREIEIINARVEIEQLRAALRPIPPPPQLSG